jgi:uncharacterized protein YdiU (UPF0061 family)
MSWLKHTYSDKLPESLYTSQKPQPTKLPQMILFNEMLVDELGVSSHFFDAEKTLNLLSGNELLPGSRPISQAYAGHQFGHFTRLGDGRAVLLGEMETGEGLYDLQLKGSGQTPYSRGGDGRATYYSMLREYLISEAIHALGIPTSRSLAVVRTKDKILREQINEGGILSRVASSHIRVGTFEFARYYGKPGDLEALLRYTINRHYPEVLDHPNHALGLLEVVMRKQLDLIINWLRVGFIHGVMNTDNMSIAGESIDYGPCAFMNAYHPGTVFSSIDTQGRYAYGNQPNIGFWNLRVLANALFPLIDKDEEAAKQKAEAVLNQFPGDFSKAYFEMMGNKLGIVYQVDKDRELVEECLGLLEKEKVDFTNFFTELRRGGDLIQNLRKNDAFDSWYAKWEVSRVKMAHEMESEALMAKNNPVIIPRNHIVEEVLKAAVDGDIEPFKRLLAELSTPYEDTGNLQIVPAGFDAGYQTFCGT